MDAIPWKNINFAAKNHIIAQKECAIPSDSLWEIIKKTRRNETYPLGHIAGGACRLWRNVSRLVD
jgi:hypothetical protein